MAQVNFVESLPVAAATITALGENIALVFAAAREAQQGETVVREALALFGALTSGSSTVHMNDPVN